MTDPGEVLALLAERRNVLLAGPPGTGKSMLLGEVAALFERHVEESAPKYNATASVPIPTVTDAGLPGAIGQAASRRVFRSVLHQSSKYREFLTGMMPDAREGAAPGKFRVTQGVLYKASEYAKRADHAALVIIDEINRGPAVQVFGGSIVAMEGDKRLGPGGERKPWTQYFDLLDPKTGDLIEYAFPESLYLLAAMNQADVSVEPLDVAFLRRWAPVPLEPSSAVLREHFDIGDDEGEDLPDSPSSRKHVLQATVRAFEAINKRIALGRGAEFRIGHGMLMAPGGMPSDLAGVLRALTSSWGLLKNHIEEVFFGDVRGASVVLNADLGIQGNPYVLVETSFGDVPKAEIEGPIAVGPEEIYGLMRALARSEQRGDV